MATGGRNTNDYRRAQFGTQSERLIAFVCECIDETCRRAVLLTGVQYDALRVAGKAVVVDSSHDAPDVVDSQS